MERKKQALIEFYKRELNVMFSDQDFNRFISKASDKIVKYSQLPSYNTIEDLINENDYKIILIESKKNSGHWTVLIRVNNSITFFDSYGIYPDNELNFVSKITNKLLGNKHNEIRRLMNTFNGKKFYSKTKYQAERNDINTCGRWIVIALHLLYQLKLSLQEMKNTLDKMKRECNKPFDLLAVDFTA